MRQSHKSGPSLLFALSLLPEGLGFRVMLRLTGSCRHRTTTVTKVSALYAKVMQDFGINHMNQCVSHSACHNCMCHHRKDKAESKVPVTPKPLNLKKEQ